MDDAEVIDEMVYNAVTEQLKEMPERERLRYAQQLKLKRVR